MAWSVGTMRSMDAPPSGSAPVIAPRDQALPEAPAVESGPDADRPSDSPVYAGGCPETGPTTPRTPRGLRSTTPPVVAIAVGTVVVMVAAVVLRFWTRSDLWLDEALTVNIARLPAPRASPPSCDGTAPPRCSTCCSTSGWAGSAPPMWRSGRCPGWSAWSRCRWPGWPGTGSAGGGWGGRPCSSWPPRRSPPATTPRPGCTRWWCCSPCSGSWRSTGRSGSPVPANLRRRGSGRPACCSTPTTGRST